MKSKEEILERIEDLKEEEIENQKNGDGNTYGQGMVYGEMIGLLWVINCYPDGEPKE